MIDARYINTGNGLQVGAGPDYPLEVANSASDLLKTHSKGSFSAFSTSSTSYVNVTGATITKDTQAAKNAVIFEFPIDNSANEYALQLLIDGIAQTDSQFQDASLTDNGMVYYYFLTDALTAGSRTFQLQAKSVTGGAINLGAGNVMVYELDTNFDGYRTRFATFNTTSTSYVDVTGASVSQTTRTHKAMVNATFPLDNGTSGYAIQLMMNGVAVTDSELTDVSVQKNGIVSVNWIVEGVPNGANTFKLQIKRTSGASTLTLGAGNFTVIEQSESLSQDSINMPAFSTTSATYVTVGLVGVAAYEVLYTSGLSEVAAVTGETTVPSSSGSYEPTGTRKIFVAGTGTYTSVGPSTVDLKVKYDGSTAVAVTVASVGPQVGIAAAGLVTVSAGTKSVSSSFTKANTSEQLLQYSQLFWNVNESVYTTQQSTATWPTVNSPTPTTLVSFTGITIGLNDRIFVFGAGATNSATSTSPASNITFEYDSGSPTTFLNEQYAKDWSNAEQKPIALAAITPALAAGTYTVRQKANSVNSVVMTNTVWSSGIIVIPATIPAAGTTWSTVATVASQTQSCTINASGTRKILIGVSHSVMDVSSYVLDLKFDGSTVKTSTVGTYTHGSFSLHVVDVPSAGNHTVEALFTVTGGPGTYSGSVFAFELDLGSELTNYDIFGTTELSEVAAVTGETTITGSSQSYETNGDFKVFMAGTGDIYSAGGTTELRAKYDGASYFSSGVTENTNGYGVVAAGLATLTAGTKSASSSTVKTNTANFVSNYIQCIWNIDPTIYDQSFASATTWSTSSATVSTFNSFGPFTIASNDRIFVFGAGTDTVASLPGAGSQLELQCDGGTPTNFNAQFHSANQGAGVDVPVAICGLTPALTAGTYTARIRGNSATAVALATSVWNSGAIKIPASIPAAQLAWTQTALPSTTTQSVNITTSGTRKILIGVSYYIAPGSGCTINLKFDGVTKQSYSIGDVASRSSFMLFIVDTPAAGTYAVAAEFVPSSSVEYSGQVFAFELEGGTLSSSDLILDTTEDKALVSFSAPIKNLNSNFALRLLQNGTEIGNSEITNNSANENGVVTISGIATGLSSTLNTFRVQAKRTSGSDPIEFSAGKFVGFELPDYQRVNPGFVTAGDTIKMSHNKDGILIGTGDRLSAASMQNNDSGRGFMGIPRMTATERTDFTTKYSLGAAHEGLFIFNLTTGKLNFWNGAVWEVVTSA